MELIGDVLKVIGVIICIVSTVLSRNRAMDDDNMDKSDVYWGRYIIEYEDYTKLLILGIVVLVIGCLM